MPEMIIVYSYVVPASQDSRSKVHVRRIVPFSHLVLGPGLRELSFFPLLPLLKDKLLAGPETEVRKVEEGEEEKGAEDRILQSVTVWC